MTASRRAGALALMIVVTTALAGCVTTHHQASTPIATPTPSGSAPAPAVPTYDPTGTASDNLVYFNTVGHALLDTNPTANTQGKIIVDWFVAHGFDKTNMEVTPDKTAIGLAVWNIDFSVRFGNTCLLGQAGNVGFQSAVLPILATGKCLIGQTRTIDW